MKKKVLISIVIAAVMIFSIMPSFATAQGSEGQVTEKGGVITSDDGKVEISKLIEETDIENVFDITLTVKTQQDIKETLVPDNIAVVIVMDISNTMATETLSSGDTRYEAVMKAAEDFLVYFDEHADKRGVQGRKVGFVAFNTDAHEIFPMTSFSEDEPVDSVISKMKSGTQAIIYKDNYKESHERFTNIEAGIKMGADMLNSTGFDHKYMIFLSDGMPTTYISSGYKGYDPYMSAYTGERTPGTDGYFYDGETKKECLHGTNYSDKAALRAENAANAAKNSGIKIYSIGTALNEDEDIKDYIRTGDFSVVDYSGTGDFAIGAGGTTADFKNWLEKEISSGKYSDCYNTNELKQTFSSILEHLEAEAEKEIEGLWIAKDPIPTEITPGGGFIEFIHLYDKNGEAKQVVFGERKETAENTAEFKDGEISWDIKNSGYSYENGRYVYTLKYRVRLKNEQDGFVMKDGDSYKKYITNGETTLSYKTVELNGGDKDVSEEKTLIFPVPSVRGYLADLEFIKTDENSSPLLGAEFTLIHAPSCNICRGDNTAVAISDMKAVSDENGRVLFEGIPSGHEYILKETKAPFGYIADEKEYKVEVFGGKILVSGNEAWDMANKNAIINQKAQDPEILLDVSKTVSGDIPHIQNEFLFELAAVKANDAAGGIAKEDMPMPLSSVGGVYSFSVTGEGSFTLPPIVFDRAGTFVYEIKEKETQNACYTNDQSVYTVTVEVLEENGVRTAEKTITENGLKKDAIVFDNIYTLSENDIVISKQTVNKNGSFVFEAVLYDRLTGEEISGSFDFEKTSLSAVTYGSITFDENGRARFTLSGGEEIRIKNIDAGTAFTVTEEAKQGYKTTVNGTEANSVSDTVKEDADAIIKFVNTYNKDYDIDLTDDDGDDGGGDDDNGGGYDDDNGGGDNGGGDKDKDKEGSKEDKKVKTGDSTSIALFEFIITACACVIAIALIVRFGRKKAHK